MNHGTRWGLVAWRRAAFNDKTTCKSSCWPSRPEHACVQAICPRRLRAQRTGASIALVKRVSTILGAAAVTSLAAAATVHGQAGDDALARLEGMYAIMGKEMRSPNIDRVRALWPRLPAISQDGSTLALPSRTFAQRFPGGFSCETLSVALLRGDSERVIHLASEGYPGVGDVRGLGCEKPSNWNRSWDRFQRIWKSQKFRPVPLLKGTSETLYLQREKLSLRITSIDAEDVNIRVLTVERRCATTHGKWSCSPAYLEVSAFRETEASATSVARRRELGKADVVTDRAEDRKRFGIEYDVLRVDVQGVFIQRAPVPTLHVGFSWEVAMGQGSTDSAWSWLAIPLKNLPAAAGAPSREDAPQ